MTHRTSFVPWGKLFQKLLSWHKAGDSLVCKVLLCKKATKSPGVQDGSRVAVGNLSLVSPRSRHQDSQLQQSPLHGHGSQLSTMVLCCWD